MYAGSIAVFLWEYAKPLLPIDMGWCDGKIAIYEMIFLGGEEDIEPPPPTKDKRKSLSPLYEERNQTSTVRNKTSRTIFLKQKIITATFTLPSEISPFLCE